MNPPKKALTILGALALFVNAHSAVPSYPVQNAADLQLALEKLNVLGSVLYIGAHPDDENTGVLAYFSKERKSRTAYLSLTRGDGGQNLIGAEKGAEIGIIRTQELLAARRVDGAEQFFTRAVDFGYSKTPEETFDFWGREQILADVVWVIRKFRPDIIITRFPTNGDGGHGHHTASALLAGEAFVAAADARRFPEQLKYVKPWQPGRLYWNKWRPREEETRGLPKANIGEYSPLLGKSYSEIAAESRSMHKSQGFGAAGRRGNRYDYFELVADSRNGGIPGDIFDGIDTTWKRVAGGQRIETMLNDVIQSFDPGRPAQSIPALLTVNDALGGIQADEWVDVKRTELLGVIQSCAGLWMEAIADDHAAAPGDEIRIRTTLVNRSEQPFTIKRVALPAASFDSLLSVPLGRNEPVTIDRMVRLPEDHPISQPYWLRQPATEGRFSTSDQQLIGRPENPPSLRVQVTLHIDGHSLSYSLPVVFRWTDRVDGELYRPFEVRPKITANFETPVNIFPDRSPKDVVVRLKSHTHNVSGEIRLHGSEKWQVMPPAISFSLQDRFEEMTVVFRVSPPVSPDDAVLVAEAVVDGVGYDRGLVEISYPHIPRQVLFPKGAIKVVRLDEQKVVDRIGYVMGAGDDIPACLVNLGYDVVMLNDEILENGDLGQFDAIVTGIRAYNTRDRIPYAQPKLMQYVKDGGTLVVQYNVSFGLLKEEIGPYPFTIGRDRISVENAAMRLLNPAHRLLSYPNKITRQDFEGWVQERGLYFASQWDDRYEPVLSGHDPDETDKQGSILFARYGKGVFIYSGLSWFRQLPAGVPGAYRLFVNLISAGHYDGAN
jgi:LmbE family N-acetylglucosaminyl deacetylase